MSNRRPMAIGIYFGSVGGLAALLDNWTIVILVGIAGLLFTVLVTVLDERRQKRGRR